MEFAPTVGSNCWTKHPDRPEATQIPPQFQAPATSRTHPHNGGGDYFQRGSSGL